jgi:pilus assembly protein Flp/PilA
MDRHLTTAYDWLRRSLEALFLRLRVDAGQTAAEYVGVIVIVAAILLALNGTEIGQTLKTGLDNAISDITGG